MIIIYCPSLDASSEPPYSPGSSSSDDNELPFHHLFLDSSILKIFCQLLVHAQYVCSKELELCNNISKMKGLAKCLEIKCITTGCNFIYSTYTSTRVSKTNQAGQNPFDINARSIIACCEIYHCCKKLHHWRKEINFVQKLNCRSLSTKAILLMAPPLTYNIKKVIKTCD